MWFGSDASDPKNASEGVFPSKQDNVDTRQVFGNAVKYEV